MSVGGKAVALFFLVLGIILVFFVFVQGISFFRGSQEFVVTTTPSSVDCVKYAYNIENIRYINGQLRFRIKNHPVSKDITNITIVGDEPLQFFVVIPQGSSQEVSIDLNLTDSFTFYPEACSVYRQVCFVNESRCEYDI